MKEYINHNRPSTKGCHFFSIFSTMESYEKAWGDNINDSLLKRASELAGIAGSILGRACTVTAEYEERTHQEYVPHFRQKATVTYRIPMLSIEGTELSLSLEWFESLCAPLPPELSCKIPDITVFDPKAEPEKFILRRHGSSDDEIKKEIKEEFNLTDYEAESFIQGTKEVAV